MLISFCMVCMNRLPDLKKIMPFVLAEADPSVELVVLNYGNTEGLDESLQFGDEFVKCCHYSTDYWHMSHAFNTVMSEGKGDYLFLLGSDTYPRPGFLDFVSKAAEDGYEWMEPSQYKANLVIKKDVFVALGGFDERFEFPGPEDRDMQARLERYGAKKIIIPSKFVGSIHTPDDKKTENLRLSGTKSFFSRMQRHYFEDNNARGRIAVNTKTVVIIAHAHAGTTMLTGVLERLGIPMVISDHNKPHKLEDLEIVESVEDEKKFSNIIKERNSKYAVWGFKFPGSWRYPDAIKSLRNPIYLAIFKDPVSVTRRRFGDVSRLRLISTLKQMLLEAQGIYDNRIPIHIFAYEDAYLNPYKFVADVAETVGMKVIDERIDAAVDFIRPNESRNIRLGYPTHG